MSGVEPFRRLIKLIGRAFFNGEVPPAPVSSKGKDRPKNLGIAVVILDALTRRTWVKEEELAKDLNLHPKQLRRTLRVLEQGQIVVRDYLKERAPPTTGGNGGAAGNGAAPSGARGEEAAASAADPPRPKSVTNAYCCIDYAKVVDIMAYRLHRARRKLKDELEDKSVVQEYLCSREGCGRKYNALDAMRLIDPIDGLFRCEVCNAELLEDHGSLGLLDKVGASTEDNARRKRREAIKDLLERLEKRLKPLFDQLALVKDANPPYYGTLMEWHTSRYGQELAAAVAFGGADRAGGPDSDRGLGAQGQWASTWGVAPMGETQVLVSLPGSATAATEEKAEKVELTPMKELPPWMITERMMNLTDEQRGIKRGAPQLEQFDVKRAAKEEMVAKSEVGVKAEGGAAVDDQGAREMEWKRTFLEFMRQQQMQALAAGGGVKAEARVEDGEGGVAVVKREAGEGVEARVGKGKGVVEGEVQGQVKEGGDARDTVPEDDELEDVDWE